MVPCINNNNNKQNPTRCTIVLKSFKTFIVSYFALHVSGTLVFFERTQLEQATSAAAHGTRYRRL
jgi:hypothetical protein